MSKGTPQDSKTPQELHRIATGTPQDLDRMLKSTGTPQELHRISTINIDQYNDQYHDQYHDQYLKPILTNIDQYHDQYYIDHDIDVFGFQVGHFQYY